MVFGCPNSFWSCKIYGDSNFGSHTEQTLTHYLPLTLLILFFYLFVSLLLTSWIFSAFHSNKTIINFKECPSFNQLSRKGHCLSENKQKYYKTTLQTPSTPLAKVNNVYQQVNPKNIQNQKVYRDPAINRLDNWRHLYCIPQRLCPLVSSYPAANQTAKRGTKTDRKWWVTSRF